MKKTSVIITTYNDGEFLERAIFSVLKQSYKPFEILVIDDGSNVKCAEKTIDGINSNNATQIQYFYKQNGGASSARNYGIEKASGDYIAFLDVDDEWLPKYLEEKVSLLSNADENCFGTFSGFICNPTNIKSRFRNVQSYINPDLIGKPTGFPGGAPSYLYKREYLVKLKGFDTALKQNEDFDLILRLIKAGYTLKGNNETTFIRHLRENSLTRNSHYFRSYCRVNQFLLKAYKEEYLSNSELIKRFILNALSFLSKSFKHKFTHSRKHRAKQ